MNTNMISANIITLGCSKNTVDSEIIASKLAEIGYLVLHNSSEKSDIVIINTCSFINDAKQQAIDEIFIQLERKKRKEINHLFVIGCLAQRYKEDLRESIPEADGILGFTELDQLLKTKDFDLLLNNSSRIVSTPSHYAYLKISEGCNHQCSYCAIPQIRGKHISKPIDMLVKESEILVEQGVKELILIAQDLTYYGMDISKKRMLDQLLMRLSEIKELKWIRLHYAYPLDFPYEILDVMADHSSICRYLDIPLQHINTEILKDMRRGSTSTQIYQLIEKIRSKVPGIAIRTSLISGYPLETRKEHLELVNFVRDIRFERLGVFSYSQEENTPAYPLGDPIKKSEKKKRIKEIMELQEQISLENNKKMIGSTVEVIIDRKEGTQYIGRTEFDSPEVDNQIIINSTKSLKVGDFYNVKVTSAAAYDLIGEIKKNA